MEPPTRRLNPSLEIPVDFEIWKACAGYSVNNFPPVGSLVYYFPQGHAEHADHSPVQFSHQVYSTPSIRCRVSSLEFLARTDTDEVFVKIRLMPLAAEDNQAEEVDDMVEEVDDQAAEENDQAVEENDQAVEEIDQAVEENDQFAEENDQAAEENYQLILYVEEWQSVRSFVKVLSSTDANRSQFTLTNAGAEILPKLDFETDRPPYQMLSFFDLQGKVWKFRHTFNGRPAAHKFGSGWINFVKSKNLIQGDSLVLMRDTRTNTLYISVRRKCTGASFNRRELGKVSKEEVIEAAGRAVAGEQFEIVHYPGGGLLKFVVNAELVDKALEYPWSVNMKVRAKVSIEGEPLRIQMVRGTVAALSGYDTSGLWDENSSWRMLKIHFEEPEVTVADEWISPWELEIDYPGTISTVVAAAAAAAAATIFEMNVSHNTLNAGTEGIRDMEPATGTIRLFGKVISYERKPDGNASN